MSKEKKELAGIIDATPKWVDVIGMYLGFLQDGNPKQKKIARDEIRRLAGIADDANEAQKEMNRLLVEKQKKHPSDREKITDLLEALKVIKRKRVRCFNRGSDLCKQNLKARCVYCIADTAIDKAGIDVKS